MFRKRETCSADRYRYAPDADGIDSTAWNILVDAVTVSRRKGTRGLSRFLRSTAVPPPYAALAKHYGAAAVCCLTSEPAGERPSESEIRGIVRAIYPDIARLVNSKFTRPHIESVVRELWDYEPLGKFDYGDIFVIVAAILFALIRDNASWGPLRACVAAELVRHPVGDWVRDWRPGEPASD